MATAQRRITKEYADIQKKPLDGMRISLPSEADIHQWQILIDGPRGSPYEGGVFNLHLSLPTEYPFKPPTLSFKTKIYHPNVTNDDKGSMCLGMLRADEWKPSSKVEAVLSFAQGLLLEPQPDDAVEGGIAREYKENKKEFVKNAKAWTKQYAKK
ncbi:MAG: Ubiquitin-conjugating enzyme E2 L3 [Alectoria fallacina]|uniref:E2 ubiquitin-conjugating enzyme n=1 Tax=Alectoria fallacina TaxID=1903189 RepID=A0A8H3FKW1_9LECA|nr:MAG: Ubiquitin-conjugating enzyme E2 L3 [Alectoria fallacina]